MKTIFVFVLFFALAYAAYGEDHCPKKSVDFAFCVNAALADHTFESKDRAELEEFIRKDCANEMKSYADCDGIDKSAYVNEFIQHQAEFFKKDHPKSIVRGPKDESDAQDSTRN